MLLIFKWNICTIFPYPTRLRDHWQKGEKRLKVLEVVEVFNESIC